MERIPGCLTNEEMKEHRAESDAALALIKEGWERLNACHVKSLLLIGDATMENAEGIAKGIALNYSRSDIASHIYAMGVKV